MPGNDLRATAEAKLRRLRREMGLETPGVVVGYLGPGGRPVALRGDPDEGPEIVQLGDRPVRSVPFLYAGFSALTLTAAYQPAARVAIDVRQWRTVSFALRYAPAAAANRLSIIVEGAADQDAVNANRWEVLPVLESVLTQVNPAGATYGNVFGRRVVFAAEFLSPDQSGANTTDAFNVVLSFDADAIEFVSLSAAETGGGAPGTLTCRARLTR